MLLPRLFRVILYETQHTKTGRDWPVMSRCEKPPFAKKPICGRHAGAVIPLRPCDPPAQPRAKAFRRYCPLY